MDLTKTILGAVAWLLLTIALPFYLVFKGATALCVNPDGTFIAVISFVALVVLGFASWKLSKKVFK